MAWLVIGSSACSIGSLMPSIRSTAMSAGRALTVARGGVRGDRRFWGLSPAFDVNPTPAQDQDCSTSIMGAVAMPGEVEGLLALAEDCGLKQVGVLERVGHVATSLSGWRDRVRANRIPEREIAMMAEAVEPRLEALERVTRSATQ